MEDEDKDEWRMRIIEWRMRIKMSEGYEDKDEWRMMIKMSGG